MSSCFGGRDKRGENHSERLEDASKSETPLQYTPPQECLEAVNFILNQPEGYRRGVPEVYQIMNRTGVYLKLKEAGNLPLNGRGS